MYDNEFETKENKILAKDKMNHNTYMRKNLKSCLVTSG